MASNWRDILKQLERAGVLGDGIVLYMVAGMQLIRARKCAKRTKLLGAKKGDLHLIGLTPIWIALVPEGNTAAAPHEADISRFYFDLINGDVPGITAMPALAKHVYEAYRTWCVSSGHRAARMPKLINTLKHKHKVEATRERWRDEYAAIRGPHSFFLLGGTAKTKCPLGKDRRDWLGECARAFENQLDNASRQAAA